MVLNLGAIGSNKAITFSNSELGILVSFPLKAATSKGVTQIMKIKWQNVYLILGGDHLWKM